MKIKAPVKLYKLFSRSRYPNSVDHLKLKEKLSIDELQDISKKALLTFLVLLLL